MKEFSGKGTAELLLKEDIVNVMARAQGIMGRGEGWKEGGRAATLLEIVEWDQGIL